MLKFAVSLVLLVITSSINAQDSKDIYALIVGISDYQDPSIRDLRFADRDAETFAEYLQSESGGNVPLENIKLLTNEDATIANIYVEKKWLEDKAKEGGMAYFYFSGHGDMESSLYDLGFLLAADTPSKNYLNNAVRIEDINNMANTLSVLDDVNVVLITDACHAGKLSGWDNRGQQLVGEQLTRAQSNEVRIASCDSSQLSQEGIEWGGGRGAFSYYLIKGLTGLADDQNSQDGLVTLKELKSYLDSNVSTSVKLNKLKKQTPIVKGDENTPMAVVNQEQLRILTQGTSSTSLQANAEPDAEKVIAAPQNRYFKNIKNLKLKDLIDFPSWTSLTKDQIVDSVLTRFPSSEDSLLVATNWYTDIRSNKDLRDQFAQQLGAFLHNEAQQAINGYLTGDKEELAKRQYYNILEQNFDEYPSMLEVAEKLIAKENYLYEIIKMKKYYFKGLDDRYDALIKGNNTDSLMKSALEAQKQAKKLNSKAAFVLNELGILSTYFKNYEEAKTHYNKASELIPSWAVPCSNLSRLYYTLGQYDKGIQAGKDAITAQDDYYLAYLTLGLNAQESKDYLLAEECFQKATIIDSKHYRAFETLGYLYTLLTDYKLSEYYFLEAEKRKNPFLLPSDDMGGFISDILDLGTSKNSNCVIDTSLFGKQDIMGMLVYAREAIIHENYDIAERFLRQIVQLDNTNPLVYRYLADIYYIKEDWAIALDYFKLAKANYLSNESFDEHFQKLLSSQIYIDCEVTGRYQWSQYPFVDLHYRIAEVAEKIHYYQLAADEYEKWIIFEPTHVAPYYKLWQLYESQSLYELTESTIQRLKPLNEKEHRLELYRFYQRMINLHIDAQAFRYKIGMLMYNIVMADGAAEQEEYHTFNKNFYNYSGITPREIKYDGTVVQYQPSEPFYFPILIGIENFVAIEAELSLEKRADVCNILGELYDYYGDDNNSKTYYKIATELKPNNQSYKLEYFLKLQETFELTTALSILDSLNDRKAILTDDLETYTKYLAMNKRYDESFEAFKRLKKIKIVEDSIITRNEIIAYLLSNDNDQAISRYLKLEQKYPENFDTQYSLARLYAQQGKKKKAYKYLEAALKQGFDYQFVINTDPYFSNLRESNKWKKNLNTYGLQLEEILAPN